jgi:hypothetical protein
LGAVVSVTGNVTGGNIVSTADVSAGGVVSAVGNITGGNILTSGLMSSTGNINGGNIGTAGGVSATTTIISGSATALGGSATYNDQIGQNKTTATLTIGGIAQTGFIQLGRSTATQGVYIANGAVSSGNTKTISIGENGVANSITNINIGTAAGNGNVTFSANTLVAIANTSGTALSVAGNITGGNILTAGIMSSTGNAIHGNLTVSTGTVTLGNIVNANGNAVGNIGSATTYFNTIFGKATTAQYADLAELYSSDTEYTPGTVVDFGGSQEITLSTQSASARVAGVVSTNPAHLMNSTLESEHTATVALTGRVPTSVTGTVRKGDMMVSAGNGHAQASATPAMGTVIGKALADFDGVSGVIEIVVGRL